MNHRLERTSDRPQVSIAVHDWSADPRLSHAEALALGALATPVSTVLVAYALDLLGLRFLPAVMLPVAAASGVGAWLAVRRHAHRAGVDTRMIVVSVTVVFAWLLWLSWPDLLPLSTGPDVTHHLLLVGFIEQRWRLVHDPAVERFLGEMAQYTAGSHILVALTGAWSGSGGLRAMHALQSATVALKAGFLYLIAVRLMPPKTPRALAIVSVVLLAGVPRYSLGVFTEFGFLAQVVAELFVVAMWWMVSVWDAAPNQRIALAFSVVGAATFLTWPVYVGPPVLTFFVVAALRTDLDLRTRVRHLLTAYVPLGVCAAGYLVGRLGWLQLASTGGAAPWPALSTFGLPFVCAASLGGMLAALRREGRVAVLFAVSTLVQALVFYVLASRRGSSQPYMALKMFYLLVWPAAAFGSVAAGEVWQWGVRLSARLGVRLTGTSQSVAAWLGLAGIFVSVFIPLWRTPKLLHPLPPAVSASLDEAGVWAREHLPPGCIDYLVGDDETAYWLHLAVLGNPRMSARTGDNSTYEPTDAILRWLAPGGLPYAIADLPALPRDVREELAIVRRFGTAAVVKRTGPSSCAETALTQ